MRSLATTTSLVAVDEVGGGATADAVVGVLDLVAMLVCEEVGVDLIKSEIILDAEGGDQRVVVGAESSEDVGDDLLLTQWLPNGSKGVSEGLHVAEVVGHSNPFLLR
jgi:hypothetical protein